MFRYFVFCFLVIGFIGISSCSKDDDDGVPPDSEMGSATVKVTGEVEDEFTGMVDFELDQYSNTYMFDISIHDFSPQTFSVSFHAMSFSDDDLEIPGPGTYTLGTFPKADYGAEFIHIIDEDFVNTFDYYSFDFLPENEEDEDVTGVLSITSSNEDKMEGSFEFTAHRTDDDLNILGTVEVSGEFSAHRRIY